MKQIITIFPLVLVLQIGFAQVVAIQNIRGDQLYVCDDNHLKVAVEKCPSKDIQLAIDNGKIIKEQNPSPGYFTVMPEHEGLTTIYVRRKTAKGYKIIDSQFFHAHLIPLPNPTLNGKSGGAITKSELCKQVGLVANMNWGGCGMYRIDSFIVIAYCSCGKEIFRRSMTDKRTGTRIDSVTNEFFTTLKNKDKVVFKDFTVFICTERVCDSLVFTVTDAEKYIKPVYTPVEEYEYIDPVTGISTVKRH